MVASRPGYEGGGVKLSTKRRLTMLSSRCRLEIRCTLFQQPESWALRYFVKRQVPKTARQGATAYNRPAICRIFAVTGVKLAMSDEHVGVFTLVKVTIGSEVNRESNELIGKAELCNQ